MKGIINSESLPSLKTRLTLQYGGHAIILIFALFALYIQKINHSKTLKLVIELKFIHSF
jgi:hypothetical protein